MNIHESAEDYLEAILILRERQGMVRSIDVVHHLEVTKPSVSVAMKRFRENGYIEMDGDGYIILLPPGEEIAQRIYGRHKLLTQFLKGNKRTRLPTGGRVLLFQIFNFHPFQIVHRVLTALEMEPDPAKHHGRDIGDQENHGHRNQISGPGSDQIDGNKRGQQQGHSQGNSRQNQPQLHALLAQPHLESHQQGNRQKYGEQIKNQANHADHKTNTRHYNSSLFVFLYSAIRTLAVSRSSFSFIASRLMVAAVSLSLIF